MKAWQSAGRRAWKKTCSASSRLPHVRLSSELAFRSAGSNGKVAVVELNRPQRMNALSFGMGDEIKGMERKLEREDARAIVITGAGGKAFSTGRDLKDSKNHTKEDAFKYMCLARDTVLAVKAIGIPTVAAVNGFSFGWGMELALACDLRVIAKDATLCFPEASLGIFPGAMGTVLLPRIVGTAVAKDLIFTSRRFNGEEAFRLGLANRIAESPAHCVDAAIALADQISQNGPLGLKGGKTVIDQGMDLSFKEHCDLSDKFRFPLNDTEDFAEALRAFAEGRKPVFVGK